MKKQKQALKTDRKSGDEVRTILTATKLNSEELRQVKRLAYVYTKNGDVSSWVRAAILNYRPSRSELETVEITVPKK